MQGLIPSESDDNEGIEDMEDNKSKVSLLASCCCSMPFKFGNIYRIKDGHFCLVAEIWPDNGWARPYIE